MIDDILNIIIMCYILDHFLSRIMEYRDEMTEMTSSLKQNMKMMRKKIKHFFVESSEWNVYIAVIANERLFVFTFKIVGEMQLLCVI